MNEIVKSLSYQLVAESYRFFDIVFDSRDPIDCETDLFAGHLEKDVLTIQMKAHLAVLEARGHVEKYLSAWVVEAGLRAGRPIITFQFMGSVARRQEAAPGTRTVSKELAVSWDVKELLHLAGYPPAPVCFALSPLVEILWSRYSAYRRGQEPLAAMAYMCLSIVESEGAKTGAKKRRLGASKLFGLHPDVLDTLGELVSTVGDMRTARKAPEQERPYTERETGWIEAAVAAMISQAGRLAFDPAITIREIVMADLPEL